MWRNLVLENGIVYPPMEGWGDIIYLARGNNLSCKNKTSRPMALLKKKRKKKEGGGYIIKD